MKKIQKRRLIDISSIFRGHQTKDYSEQFFRLNKFAYIYNVIIFNTIKFFQLIKNQFSISLHIMALLAIYSEDWLSSSLIASSININPVLVRNEIAILKKGGLVESKAGKLGGVRLLKKANQIYLSDIFTLIKGENHVLTFSSNTPNPSCVVGRQINKNLESVMDSIDNSILKELKNQTLEDFKSKF